MYHRHREQARSHILSTPSALTVCGACSRWRSSSQRRPCSSHPLPHLQTAGTKLLGRQLELLLERTAEMRRIGKAPFVGNRGNGLVPQERIGQVISAALEPGALDVAANAVILLFEQAIQMPHRN